MRNKITLLVITLLVAILALVAFENASIAKPCMIGTECAKDIEHKQECCKHCKKECVDCKKCDECCKKGDDCCKKADDAKNTCTKCDKPTK